MVDLQYVSGVQQSDSYIYIYIYKQIFFFRFFFIIDYYKVIQCLVFIMYFLITESLKVCAYTHSIYMYIYICVNIHVYWWFHMALKWLDSSILTSVPSPYRSCSWSCILLGYLGSSDYRVDIHASSGAEECLAPPFTKLTMIGLLPVATH